jgi:hypothetical protein
VLSAFAEAINTEAQLERLKEIGIQLDVDVDGAIVDIERNIKWIQVKGSEIAAWVNNEAGSAVGLKLSLMSVILFSFVIFFIN